MRVLLFTDRPTQNRVDFWNMLGKQCELTVLSQGFPKKTPMWEYSTIGNNFKCEFLQGLSYGKSINISFGVAAHINSNLYDVVVLANCLSYGEKAAIRELKSKGKSFIYASEGAFPKEKENLAIKKSKAKYIQSASYYLSCGSVCDEYLLSYGANNDKIIRYNYSSVSQEDHKQVTPMTIAREKGLLRRYNLKDNTMVASIEFSSQQGIDLLLDIWKFAGMKDTTLLLISDAKKHKRLQKMVRRLRVNDIVMIDYQPKERVRDIYTIANAFIYPARHDDWGLVVGEALSCGLPVISSYNVGSVHDLVHNEYTGYVQNVYEPIAWGVHMRTIVKRQQLKENMGKNAIKLMKDYTIESMVDSYMDTFRRYIREQGN